MNKKGGIVLGFIFALGFMILGFLMIPFAKDMATDSRTDLDCTNSSISDGTKLTCLWVGAGVPLYVIAILTFIGGLIGSRL